LNKELRDELKRDEAGDLLQEARAFLTRSEVMKPALAVIGLFLVLGGLYYGQKFRAASSESAFARATEVFHGTVGSSASGETFKTEAEKYQKAKTMFDAVASSYSSSPAGRRARYYSALCVVEMGQVTQAEELLKPIAAMRDASMIEPALARLLLAELALHSGRAKEAAKEYQVLIDDPASGLPKDRLFFGLAESLEAAGQKLEARRAYTDLVNRHPQSPYSQDARLKMDALAAL
jgi:TolA-binding protein